MRQGVDPQIYSRVECDQTEAMDRRVAKYGCDHKDLKVSVDQKRQLAIQTPVNLLRPEMNSVRILLSSFLGQILFWACLK